MQLVAQHCVCKLQSFKIVARITSPASNIRIKAKSRTEFYFVQHVAATCNTEICCATSCLIAGVVIRATKLCNLQSNNVAHKLQGNVARITWPLRNTESLTMKMIPLFLGK